MQPAPPSTRASAGARLLVFTVSIFQYAGPLPGCPDSVGSTVVNTRLLRDAAVRLERAIGAPAPQCALILGSGWGESVRSLTVERTIRYADIPVLGAAAVEGHAGMLHVADCDGRRVLVFQGRRHWYEGCGWEPVVLPVYLCVHLRTPVLLLTNAAGGIRPGFKPGDLMAIDDHLNAMGVNPLVGPHDPIWGPRFPDQTEVYDRALRALLDQAAAAAGCRLSHGVYAAAAGPAYETPAEVAALRRLGADAVGMSTVPEALLAHAAGIRVAGLSCIANVAAGLADAALSHEDVLRAAREAAPRMSALVAAFLQRLPLSAPNHEQLRPQSPA
jgi:purine-nucleoside phosphorylase